MLAWVCWLRSSRLQSQGMPLVRESHLIVLDLSFYYFFVIQALTLK
jgi:hypothetical protein